MAIPRGFLTFRPLDLLRLDAVTLYLRTRRGPVANLRARGGMPLLPLRIVPGARIQSPVRIRPIPLRAYLAARQQAAARAQQLARLAQRGAR
jgi:hypothetical protein